ncbi:hypothetical protein B0H63DRAFT_549029 [Podospora didyma]|uniref:Uncharacterized protein n=1 Tax=Podospora didyma TaxID=330526 RepID=A0AAE0N9U7_9PEZI|nr:hypothetical protein B0H63DRAFT_549029 [Podospora didyma]
MAQWQTADIVYLICKKTALDDKTTTKGVARWASVSRAIYAMTRPFLYIKDAKAFVSRLEAGLCVKVRFNSLAFQRHIAYAPRALSWAMEHANLDACEEALGALMNPQFFAREDVIDGEGLHPLCGRACHSPLMRDYYDYYVDGVQHPRTRELKMPVTNRRIPAGERQKGLDVFKLLLGRACSVHPRLINVSRCFASWLEGGSEVNRFVVHNEGETPIPKELPSADAGHLQPSRKTALDKFLYISPDDERALLLLEAGAVCAAAGNSVWRPPALHAACQYQWWDHTTFRRSFAFRTATSTTSIRLSKFFGVTPLELALRNGPDDTWAADEGFTPRAAAPSNVAAHLVRRGADCSGVADQITLAASTSASSTRHFPTKTKSAVATELYRKLMDSLPSQERWPALAEKLEKGNPHPDVIDEGGRHLNDKHFAWERDKDVAVADFLVGPPCGGAVSTPEAREKHHWLRRKLAEWDFLPWKQKFHPVTLALEAALDRETYEGCWEASPGLGGMRSHSWSRCENKRLPAFELYKQWTNGGPSDDDEEDSFFQLNVWAMPVWRHMLAEREVYA